MADTDTIDKFIHVDLYNVLCITKENFTSALCEKKYKKLSLKYHPDKRIGMEPEDDARLRYQYIQLAHNILKNPISKQYYDDKRGELDDAQDEIDEIDDIEALHDRKQIEIKKMTKTERQEILNAKIKNLYNEEDEVDETTSINNLMAQAIAQRDKPIEYEERVQVLLKDNKSRLDNAASQEEKERIFNEIFNQYEEKEEDDGTYDVVPYSQSSQALTKKQGTRISDLDYSSMYKKKQGNFKDAFKVNKIGGEIEEVDIEEAMKEYEAEGERLGNNIREEYGGSVGMPPPF